MAYSIDIAEAAEKDIREAFLYYEDQKQNLGSTFESGINNVMDSIQRNPLKTQIRYGKTRVYFLRKFPFGIHFEVDEAKELILIVAVFHTSQNPKHWTGR